MFKLSVRPSGCQPPLTGDEGAARHARAWSDGRCSIEVTEDDRCHLLVTSANTAAIVQTRQHAEGISSHFDLEGPAVAVWDLHARKLTATRDAIGTRSLYFTATTNGLLVSDSLDAFDAPYDLAFVADFIASAAAPIEGSIRRDVKSVAPGTILTYEVGKATCRTYWSTDQFAPERRRDAADAAEEFLALAQSAVLKHLDASDHTWAQLSGGLDSCSVVAIAAAMHESGRTARRIGGTITFADSLGNADETSYSDAVVDRFGLQNAIVRNFWPWRSDGELPPVTDQPDRDYPFYARNRVVTQIVRSKGGTRILSGVGPDHYLPLSPSLIPDLLRSGRLAEASRALLSWTLATRQSFWSTIPEHAITPLVPRRLRHWRTRRRIHMPEWLNQTFVKTHELRRRFAMHDIADGRRDDSYQGSIRRQFQRLGAILPRWHTDGVAIGHPLLDPPLVEFCLRLPRELRTNYQMPKPVLRTAMTGLLPESVRLRSTKSHFGPRIRWALGRERTRLGALLKRSVLADMGCIEPHRIQTAIDDYVSGRGADVIFLYAALSLDTWLIEKSSRRTITHSTQH